jgi:hypothetical protein
MRCKNNDPNFWERWGNGGEPETVVAVSFRNSMQTEDNKGNKGFCTNYENLRYLRFLLL